MSRSRDPAHDQSHAERVATFAAQLAADTKLTETQTQALILAAWWHDVSRTLTKKPSIIVMPFIDDLLSAFQLWSATLRIGLFGSATGMATRIIFCKSFGTGAFLTRILLRRRNRILVDIIKDADALDVLNCERITTFMPLVERSRCYRFGYRAMIRRFLSTKELQMKTQAARAYVIRLLRAFILWAKQTAVAAWHVAQFGKRWYAATLRRGERLLQKIERLYFVQSEA